MRMMTLLLPLLLKFPALSENEKFATETSELLVRFACGVNVAL